VFSLLFLFFLFIHLVACLCVCQGAKRLLVSFFLDVNLEATCRYHRVVGHVEGQPSLLLASFNLDALTPTLRQNFADLYLCGQRVLFAAEVFAFANLTPFFAFSGGCASFTSIFSVTILTSASAVGRVSASAARCFLGATPGSCGT
jgi:hypothetical protein